MKNIIIISTITFISTLFVVSNVYSYKFDQNVYDVQKVLKYLGYKVIKIDGKLGKNTKREIKKFQKDYSLSVSGKPDFETLKIVHSILSNIKTTNLLNSKTNTIKQFKKLPLTKDAHTRGIAIVAEDPASKKLIEIQLYNKTYAVIIGIDEYPALSYTDQLSYAVSDAKAVENMIKNKFVFHEIFTLYNEQATKSNILDILLNKLAKTTDEDAVFIFFAGHGGEEETNFGPIGFLIPYDGDFIDMRKVISMTTIRDDISKIIKAKHVFYVMDACYSGLLVSTRGIDKKIVRELSYLKQLSKEPVRQVLTAGSSKQKVLDSGPLGHSVFTGRFLEVLDESDDYITASEICTIVKERVFSDAKSQGYTQTPKSGELFGLGDFIFMPSMTKKVSNIQQQITEIQQELEEIKRAEIKAQQLQDETGKREAERKIKIAEAKLKAINLEKKRLEQEKIFKEKQEKERQKQINFLKKKKEEDALRLASLKKDVIEKRKKYKSSMIFSLDAAVKEMQSINRQIYEIKAKFLEELRKRILNIAWSHTNNYKNVKLVKDEFETETEYKSRLAKQVKSKQVSNQEKFGNAMNIIESEYKEQISPFLKQIKEISSNVFMIYGHDALNVKLGRYDADKEAFKITIASKNINRSIYTQGRFYFVSETHNYRQARKVGIKNGDMIIKYNNTYIKPGTNWDHIIQTVLSNNVVMEIERQGRQLQFTLEKGYIGINTYIDDYVRNLKPNQFLVNGDLYVKRKDARKFKQNYLNDLITAELKVKAITPSMTLVIKAEIIDESDEKRYDLFKSEFINLGDNLTYDTKKDLLWLTKYRDTILTKTGSHKYVKRFEYKEIKGWQIPKRKYLKSLKGTQIYPFFNFGPKNSYKSYHQVSDIKHPYRPREDGNCFKDEGYVICVYQKFMSKSNYILGIYALYKNRYISIAHNLVFDSKNRILWITAPESTKEYSKIEAKHYIQQLDYFGLKGWRLPKIEEFQSLQDSSIPGIHPIFNFEDYYYQVINNYTYPTYQPSKDSSCCRESGFIIGVM